MFNTINFRSDLTATNGQTLIVGGIIQKEISNTLRKTPLLGSVPGVKWAFNKENKTTQNVELMVFLRPRIIRTGQDAATRWPKWTPRRPRSESGREKWSPLSRPAKNQKISSNL